MHYTFVVEWLTPPSALDQMDWFRAIKSLRLRTSMVNQFCSVDGAHFCRPWYQRHVSCRVCHVSGYRSLPGSSPGAVYHMCHAAKNDISQFSGGPSSQILALLREVRFIAWYMRRPILRECRQVPRNLRKCWTHLDYGLPLESTFKKSLVSCTQVLMKRVTNTVDY